MELWILLRVSFFCRISLDVMRLGLGPDLLRVVFANGTICILHRVTASAPGLAAVGWGLALTR